MILPLEYIYSINSYLNIVGSIDLEKKIRKKLNVQLIKVSIILQNNITKYKEI